MIFDWPRPHALRVVLPTMIVAALLIHIGALWIFGVAYPGHPRTLPSVPQVFSLLPGTPEEEAATPWIQADDPALFSPARNRAKELPEPAMAPYDPGFDHFAPSIPRLVEPAATAISTAWTPGTVPVVADDRTALPPSPAAVPAPTRLVLSGDIAGRRLLSVAPSHFRPPGGNPVQPTEFAVAIAPDGTALHALQQAGSGDAALDRVAQEYLSKAKFDPAPGESPAWGTATFLWGDDLEQEKRP